MNNMPYELIARYLAGECNESEEQQVREWARQHPGLMDECTEMWQQIPAQEFNPDTESALRKVNIRIDKKKNRSKRLYLFAACAAAAVLVFVSIIAIRFTDPATVAHTDNLLSLNTGTTETLEYTLPDGSKISLNRSSVLTYPKAFDGNTREVYLEGEAFFDVAPNAEKPFIIHANNTKTTVVGTSFGIRAIENEDKVVVTVSTGVVNLSAEGKSDYVKLTQGEQGICLPKKEVLEKNANPDPNLLAWKTKILIFKQSPLTEVAKAIENTYHTPVTVDRSIAGLQLTSTFERRSLEEVMQIIGLSLQVEVETNENGILITTK